MRPSPLTPKKVQQAQSQVMASGSLPVPMLPFADPGASQRSAAQDLLNRARSQLTSAGNTAAEAVGRARDKAPEQPGFWSKVGNALSGFGHDVVDVGEHVVNGVASVGNAIIHHPGDLLSIAGGLGLTAISSVGEGAGTVLDATGVGAVAGAPLNAVSAAGIAGGIGVVGVGVGDLARHAAGDNRVSAMQGNSSSSGGGGGGLPTKTDRIAEHLTPKDLEGAQRELNGEVVATKDSGTPYDHITEVRDAQQGAGQPYPGHPAPTCRYQNHGRHPGLTAIRTVAGQQTAGLLQEIPADELKLVSTKVYLMKGGRQ
jgi:hypothetical protein